MNTAERTIVVQCPGRTSNGDPALQTSHPVTVGLLFRDDSLLAGGGITCAPQDCLYNAGGHADKCRANPDDRGAYCHFAFDFPHGTGPIRTFRPPKEVNAPFTELLEIFNSQ